MPPSIPRQPERGPHRVELDARLSAELLSAMAGARRRAARDGDRQIDTAHLLHSLLESDQQVRHVFDASALARLLGYLVQRSIGYGLQWQTADEMCRTALPVAPQTGWSGAAACAMDAARKRSEQRGDMQARGLDLLGALASDAQCRAVEVLRRAGVTAADLETRIKAAQAPAGGEGGYG